jgi:hypothetical protein
MTDDHYEPDEIIDLRQQIADLRTMIGNVAQATAIENVISNGFLELSAQLQPLQDLTPRRTSLSDAANAHLLQLQRALERPQWQGTQFHVDPKNHGLNRRLAP